MELYPEPLRAEIDALNERVYQTVNDGPYRVAGAATQADYERLRQAMIATLDELDRRLADRRLLFGGQITEADIRLWPTLARFDTGYNPMAGVSERRLTDFPNLWAYAVTSTSARPSATPLTSRRSAALPVGPSRVFSTMARGGSRSSRGSPTGTRPPGVSASAGCGPDLSARGPAGLG